MRPIFFIKSWNESDHPRNKKGEFANAGLPDKSADIQTLGQAKAYWKKHFVDNSPHRIECQYGRRKYVFHVKFERNHSYTEDKLDRRKDGERVFSLERARSMDEIWNVLRKPKSVNWSANNPSNKQFDGEFRFEADKYGRVVLKGIPTSEDNAKKQVSQFEFLSWHPIPMQKFIAAKRAAAIKHVNPLSIKKALSSDRAFPSLERQSAFLPETRFRTEALPVPEACASARPQSFQCSQSNRMDKSTDRFTENIKNHTDDSDFVKSVTLVMPSGNRYELQPGQYNFVEGACLAKALAPGERWITVNANKGNGKGQPVLVREEPDGSLRVIGGAGGKLNYLRLRGVKSESDYRKEAEERRQAKSEQRKEQHKRDKELGLNESKAKVREAILAQRKAAETDYIQTVAQSMGWDQSSLEFPEGEYSHLPEAAVIKLRNKHHRNLLDRAKQAVDLQRQKLLSDEESRLAAGIGEIPLNSQDDEVLSVDDLDPIPSQTSGLGYSTDYKGRAKQAGLTEDELSRESEEIRSAKLGQMTDAQRQAAIKRGETSRLLKQELENIREPVEGPVKILEDAKVAVELLKAEKKLKAINLQAKAKLAEVDAATSKVEPKAFVLEHTPDPDLENKIAEDIENDLRTAQTRAFLSEFHRLAGDKPEETVGKYMGIGAYNSVNSLALAVGGDALIDRSVVDVLGIAGAAQVLARRIHTDLRDDAERIAEGMEEFHLHHYMSTSEQAMTQARELMDIAREIEMGEGATRADLKTAQELNAKRRTAVTGAQKIVGQALGEMEANAALVVALKQETKDALEVSLGDISIEQAITRVRATGLQRGDYQINSSAGQTFLSINSDGMDRLAKPVNRDDIEQIKRNLSIMRGDHDEEDWLPLGVANRPDLAMNIKPGVVPRLAEPFQPGEDLERSLRDYIGGRAADGDTPADILADIQSLDFFKKAGDAEAYRVALDAVVPLKDESGKRQRIESLSDRFEEYADQFVHSRFGETRSSVNRQKFEINQNAVDALHRALSETPEGVAAYKQIGELTSADQRALREYFYRHVAKETPEASMLRHDLERLSSSEPKKEFIDMFGETAFNPDWTLWNNKRNELSKKVRAASLTWDKYIGVMRGHEKAYESIQDLIRSRVSKKFIDEHNKLNRDKPLKLGRSIIRNNLNHLDATDHDAREARLAEQRSMIDRLRDRSQGKYASGSVIEKLQEVRERKEAFEQSQMALFSTEEMPAEQNDAAPDQQDEQKIKSDERYTLGHEAERQLAGMMGIVGKNFRPGQPVKLWNPSMSGGDNYARQRAIKLIQANKRIGLHLGAGSGKTLVGLGGFTHLHQQGLVKRGIAVVPSIVQGQFGSEALRYLEPGKFNWHIKPGASREERIAAYKDPDNHLSVVTHQSLRDDLLYLGSQYAGISPKELSERVAAMTQAERKEWARDLMEKEGIDFQYMMIDEGHNLLDRQSKEDSAMSNVIGSFSANTPYYVSMTADPVRNDASEIFSALQKVAPERYTDRAEFMRRYGIDTLASKDALRREMARYFYPHKIEPKVNVKSDVINVPLSDGQKKALSSLDSDLASMRIARMQGKVDIEAAKRVSPAMFEGIPENQHESVANSLQNAIGIVRETATQRIINAHPESAKLDEVVKQVKVRNGKPGIIFSHSLEAVEAIKSRLEKEGMRVVTISGADSSKEKDRKRKMFSPDGGEEPKADILVASDAASTGLNAQRGQFLIQYDVVNTAMTHAQRRARIHRIGQENNIELIDLVGDHPSERRARERLAKKYGLRELMTSSLDGLDDTGVAAFLNRRNQSHG